MTRSQIAVVGLVVAAVVGLSGIAMWRGAREPDRPSAAMRIGFVVTTLSNPFFVDMVAGAKEEIAKHPNFELLVQAPEQASDNERQLQLVENLITQRVNALCVVPADSKSIVAAVVRANRANVAFINVDNRIDNLAMKAANARIEGFVGSDNFAGGVLAGEFVIAKTNAKGKVAILEGVSGVEAGAQRKAGFLEALKKAPDLHVVASQPADWSREKGLNVFQSIYQANPDLAALFACNDEMALGALRALPAPRKVIVVGFDATKDAVDAVERGEMDATVAQKPREMGRQAVTMAIGAAQGAAPGEQSTPLRLVTRETQ